MIGHTFVTGASLCLFLLVPSAYSDGYRVPIFHSKAALDIHRRGLTGTNLLGPMSANNVAFQVNMNIQLGSNKQTLTDIVVDTGSSPLWVPEAACVLNGAASPPCATSLFNSATSTTFMSDPAFGGFTAAYGDGTTVSGPFVQDTLTINGLAYNNFIFGLIMTKTVPAGVGQSTGIFGFAPEENMHSTAALAAFYYDTTLPTKQVSFYFPNSLTASGELFIGGADTTLYTGTPMWVPVNFQNYWVVASGQILAESITGTMSSSTGGSGIIDTGTSFLSAPQADVMAMCAFFGLSYDTVTGLCTPFCCTSAATCTAAGFPNLPNIATMPNFYLNFGNNQKLLITISQNFYTPTTVSTATQAPITCTLAIQTLGASTFVGAPQWIVGAAVIRQYYTIFDFTNYVPIAQAGTAAGTGMVGFATRVANVAVTQGPPGKNNPNEATMVPSYPAGGITLNGIVSQIGNAFAGLPVGALIAIIAGVILIVVGAGYLSCRQRNTPPVTVMRGTQPISLMRGQKVGSRV